MRKRQGWEDWTWPEPGRKGEGGGKGWEPRHSGVESSPIHARGFLLLWLIMGACSISLATPRAIWEGKCPHSLYFLLSRPLPHPQRDAPILGKHSHTQSPKDKRVLVYGSTCWWCWELKLPKNGPDEKEAEDNLRFGLFRSEKTQRPIKHIRRL